MSRLISTAKNLARIEAYTVPSPAGLEQWTFYIATNGTWENDTFIPRDNEFIPVVRVHDDICIIYNEHNRSFPTIEEAESHIQLFTEQIGVQAVNELALKHKHRIQLEYPSTETV